MISPILTIITITYNDPFGLERTLSSTASLREFNMVERIVVDGGGSNGAITCDVHGVKHLVRTPVGISDALNGGLTVAKGDWVWFLNGGDTLHSDLDANWLIKLLRETKADIVTGALHYGDKKEFNAVPPLRIQWPPVHCWIAHPATIMRRSTLVAMGGFDARWEVAMDYDLWLRLLPQDPVIDVLSIPLAVFDVSGRSQRIESGGALQRENAAVIRLHSLSLTRIWLGIGRRLAVALWRAWIQR